MRDQFAGDIRDLTKFAFLRAVTSQYSQLGVAWYYNAEHDGTDAGKHIEYKTEDKWSSLDSVVYESLLRLEDRSVKALEHLPFWPEDTIFHGEVIPSGVERSCWVRQMSELLEASDVVFVDPDNGLGAATKLHVTINEVETLGRNNRPVIMIKFPGRTKYRQQLVELHQLFDDRAITTVMTSVWVKQPRATWFSIINAAEPMNLAAQEFAERFNAIHHAKAEVCISSG